MSLLDGFHSGQNQCLLKFVFTWNHIWIKYFSISVLTEWSIKRESYLCSIFIQKSFGRYLTNFSGAILTSVLIPLLWSGSQLLVNIGHNILALSFLLQFLLGVWYLHYSNDICCAIYSLFGLLEISWRNGSLSGVVGWHVLICLLPLTH